MITNLFVIFLLTFTLLSPQLTTFLRLKVLGQNPGVGKMYAYYSDEEFTEKACVINDRYGAFFCFKFTAWSQLLNEVNASNKTGHELDQVSAIYARPSTASLLTGELNLFKICQVLQSSHPASCTRFFFLHLSGIQGIDVTTWATGTNSKSGILIIKASYVGFYLGSSRSPGQYNCTRHLIFNTTIGVGTIFNYFKVNLIVYYITNKSHIFFGRVLYYSHMTIGQK
jgi:hypothetical protein